MARVVCSGTAAARGDFCVKNLPRDLTDIWVNGDLLFLWPVNAASAARGLDRRVGEGHGWRFNPDSPDFFLLTGS